jgi:ABC-2 type transport system permease protein
MDPTTKTSFRESLQLSVHDFTSRIESQIVLQEVTKEINELLMVPVPDLSLIQEEVIRYSEEYALRGDNTVIPNSAQHNVPAWTIFAIFFIAIPLAGGMIKEREEGSLARLLTMPCNYATILVSKMMVYLMICFLQFILIMLMGMYLFPLINLPALQIGENLTMLVLLAVATSLGSIGYGILVGTVARTHQQASIFASISVVILAAIGGVWVPVFVMPPFLRTISVISPLNWGLNSYYDILIRKAAFAELLPGLTGLLLFALACLGVAIGYRMLNREQT